MNNKGTSPQNKQVKKMKLAVASLILASVALLEGATAEESSAQAGQCVAAVQAYAAASGNNGNDDQAAYYAQYYYAEEEAAEEAETAITYNMQMLAEALGLNDQDGGGANAYDDQGYLMAYDAELAESMGFNEDNEEDRATFATFYQLTYELITNSDQYECVNNKDNQDNQEGDAEENEEEEEDIIQSILQECQDLYEEAGIEVNDIDEDALKDLSLHIRMEDAITKGYLVIQDGDYEQGYKDLLDYLGIDENEIEDEDATYIMSKLAVTSAIASGDLTTYLMNTAGFGQNIDDWNEVFQGFLQYLGIDGEINLEDLDAYTKAAIYNTEMGVEESTCQQAMIAQFGQQEAVNQGYVSEEAAAAMDSMTTMEYVQMNAGVIAAYTIIAVVAVIGLVLIAYAKGKNKGLSEAEAPHGYHLDDNGTPV